MTPDETFALIRDVLIELFEFAPEQVTLEARIADDLDLDSIDAVDIIAQIQEKTGKSIDPDSFKQIQTLQDMVTIACQ